VESQKELRRIQGRQNENETDNVDTSGFDNTAQRFVVSQITLEANNLKANFNCVNTFKLQKRNRSVQRKVDMLKQV